MLGLNKSDLADAGRWIRDHFSNWFANSFVMVGVFSIIICSIYIGMYFDGAYARRWSPDAGAEHIFRNYGWLISLAMVFFTAVGVKAFQEGARGAGAIFIVAGVYFTILSATQSVGVVTLKAQQMMAQADAFVKIETTDTTRLDFLKEERQLIISTRNSEIARIEGSIDAIRNDGIPGIPRADQDSIDAYNQRIDTLRNDADAKIDALGDEIKAEMQTVPGEQIQVSPQRFDAGIDFWAYVLTFGKPTDEYKEGLTYWYMLFWSIGCPIMGQMLAVYLVITRRTRTEAEKKDPVRVKAGEKAAQTRKRNNRRTLKIQEQASGYVRPWEQALRYARTTKYTAAGIAQTAFPNISIDHVINVLRKANENGTWRPDLENEIRLVKRQISAPAMNANAVDVINPVNGYDNATDNATDISAS